MAYIFTDAKKDFVSKILPLEYALKNGDIVRITHARPEHHGALRDILNACIRDGISYPYKDEMTLEQFQAYFLASEGFTVSVVQSSTFQVDEIVVEGGFYIKPNFPGRSAHICNGGFMVKVEARGLGMAKTMATTFLKLAKELDYVASFFNLVYTNNPASVNLWRSLNFTQIGIVPKAGKCRNEDGTEYFVDAIQFYYDLATVEL